MAQYQLTEKSFIEPYILEPGSVIETNAEPSLKWLPLDEDARSRMSKLYDKEYTRIDPQTGKTERYQPHKAKRDVFSLGHQPEEKPVSRVLSTPGRPDPTMVIGLAEAATSRGIMMEDAIHRQLPGTRPPPSPPVPASASDKAQPGEELADGTKVLAPAPAPPAPSMTHPVVAPK